MTNLRFAAPSLDRSDLLKALRALRKGDFSVRMPMNLVGIDADIAAAFNDIAAMNEMLAEELARVRDEVGKEGQINKRAKLPAASGSWAECMESVNDLIGDLVHPTAEVARVIESVAKGDLSQTMWLETGGRPLRGEFLRIAKVVNSMVNQLGGFASEVSRVAREVGTEGKLGGQARVPDVAGTWKDLTDNVNQLAANLTGQVRAIAEVATAVTGGDLTRSITVQAQGELAALKDNINEMIRNLKNTTLKNTEQDWLKTNLAKFTRMLQGHRDLVTVSRLVLSELAPLVNAEQGVFYSQTARGDEPRLELLAAHACKADKHLPKTLRVGEGLIGQCAYEKRRILLTDIPDDYVHVSSVQGAAPLNVVILPVLFEGEIKAVIELASFRQFSEAHLSFLEQLTESIGIVFNTIEATMTAEDLLMQSQSLTKELQNQQEELKTTNDRLELQAENLQNSEALLKQQQEELQRTNEELQEKARLLADQMRQVEYKNREVELAKGALEEKAEQLALSSRYKSEFLANMSHELRTPLNSLLILARMLADNAGNNLTPKQIDYAHTIRAAGTDLLLLINDILDLAKIESGTVTLDIALERFSDLRDYVERTFRQVAHDKKLEFAVAVDAGLSAAIETDVKRLQQILKNLLSNAFKFTDRGEVSLNIAAAASGWTPGHAQLDSADEVAAFSVNDTGIGIPASKHRIIFEAFQQADGTTSRQYGGTGLGLSISRELTRLLGGEIRVSSNRAKGSTFTLYLPLTYNPRAVGNRTVKATKAAERGPSHAEWADGYEWLKTAQALRSRPAVRDDRQNIQTGDRVVLIVEDDAKFASTLLDLVRENGFKGVIARNGETALVLVKEVAPVAITLDLKLPDMDGWTVLDLLKHDPETRHIPVNVISVTDHMHKCFHMGALGVVQKPAETAALQEALDRTRKFIEREVKTLLVASSDGAQQEAIIGELGDDGVDITAVDSAKKALEALQRSRFDCVVVGPVLHDMSATEFLKELARTGRAAEVPIVLYGADGFSPSEEEDLRRLAEIIILKNVSTPAAVLEEATLFLHRTVKNLPQKTRGFLANQQKSIPELSGRKALIVDDDIRNIFALTGALEQHGMSVIDAENGTDGIERLKNNPDVDIVLMDIMMPELDGYDTMRLIRGLDEFKNLPIIAITAKAMKGDREKCIEAGASDYIAKPVNMEQLLSLLRVWLTHRGNGPGEYPGHGR